MEDCMEIVCEKKCNICNNDINSTYYYLEYHDQVYNKLYLCSKKCLIYIIISQII